MSRPLSREDLEHVLLHTRDLWEEIRGRAVFITGGTGFFGCWLLETFAFANEQLDLKARLVCLTRDPEAFRRKAPHLAAYPPITLWKGELRDFEFPPWKFTHVIHAGTPSSSPIPPLEMFETIVAGTRRALDFAVACGAEKFLFTSSGAVYGKQPPELVHISETYTGAPDPADPDSAYGESKRASELLCAIYHKQHGIKTKTARCFAFVGPHLPMDANYAIGNFIRDVLHGGPVRILGDGTPRRSYLYAADLSVWLWTILFKGRSESAYNVGSDEDFSIGQVARLVVETMNPNIEIIVAKKPLPEHPCLRYVPSTVLASGELGLRAWINVRESIRRTIEWHRNSEK